MYSITASDLDYVGF